MEYGTIRIATAASTIGRGFDGVSGDRIQAITAA